MGCFLGCFGLSKKRKRRKPAIGALIPDQRHVSYRPLDSVYPDLSENPISSDSELRVKPNVRSSLKIRKKVTFNLNVEAFEPIQPDYHLLKSEEEEEKNEDSLEDAEGRLLPPSDSTASRSGSYLYPSNHRYQNCVDDEDDEIVEEESDLEDYDDDDDDDDYVDDNYDESCSHSGQSCTSSVDELGEEVRPFGLNRNVRDRSNYVRPVLNPVQNLSQWKAVKARTADTKCPRKENVGSNQEAKQNQCKPELAVDASLSNWINTTKSSCSEHAIQERTLEGSNRLIMDFHQVGLI